MRSILKLEIKKAVNNKLFFISIMIGCAITMLSFQFNLELYRDHIKIMKEIKDYNTFVESYSLYNHWIGGEPFSLGTTIYFFIFPLLVAIPYGWSYCEEKKNGYVRNMVVKTGRRNYYLAKYLAVFLSGGLAMVIPLIFSFAVTALVISSKHTKSSI